MAATDRCALNEKVLSTTNDARPNDNAPDVRLAFFSVELRVLRRESPTTSDSGSNESALDVPLAFFSLSSVQLRGPSPTRLRQELVHHPCVRHRAVGERLRASVMRKRERIVVEPELP